MTSPNDKNEQLLISRSGAIDLLNVSEKQMTQLEEWAGIDPAHDRLGYSEAELKRLKELMAKLSHTMSEEHRTQNASGHHEK